jgi:hypothetical protein
VARDDDLDALLYRTAERPVEQAAPLAAGSAADPAAPRRVQRRPSLMNMIGNKVWGQHNKT